MTDAPTAIAPSLGSEPSPGPEPSASARPWTVQCSYAAFYCTTVVVEAATPDEACERALAAANDSSNWKSLDHCGDTFVDALAPGEDVNLWGPTSSVVPVPPLFSEAASSPAGADLVVLLERLVAWAGTMGGWDAPVWREAETLVARLEGRTDG